MNKNPIVFTTIFLLLILCVHADYNFYDMIGNNNKYEATFSTDAATAYNAIQIPGAKATLTEPIAFDANNDGTTELFIEQSQRVGVFEGNDVSTALGSFGNTQGISPVACDVDGDGKKDYVGIFNYNGTYVLGAAKFISPGVFDIFASMNVSPTSPYGNLVCGPFYQAQGDTRNYVMWVDLQKYLWIQTVSGTGFTGVNKSVGLGTIVGNDAVTEEAQNNTGSFPRGTYRIAYSPTMDTRGNGVVFFIAGRFVYMEFSNGNENNILVTPPGGAGGYAQSSANLGSIKLYGPVDSSGKAVVVSWENDLGTGTIDQPRAFYNVIRLGGFPFYQPSSSSFSVPLGTPFAVADTEFNPSAFTRYNASGSSAESLFIHLWEANTATGHLGVGGGQFSRFVRVSTDGTILSTSTTSFPAALVGSGDNKSTGIMMVDMNKDGYPDYVTAKSSDGAHWDVGYYDGSTSYASANFTHLQNVTTASNDVFQLPMQVVDVNGDGAPDIIINPYNDDDTYVLLSSAFGGTNTIGFTAALNNTNPFQSIQKITLAQNSTDFNYNYALICDLSETTLWNEQFLLGYNFTTQNVSFNWQPPEQYLVYNGLQFTVNATYSQFDLVKEGNTGVREISRFRLKYNAPTNSTVDLLLFASDFQITGYFRLNKTGTHLEISKVFFGNDPINVANATLSSNAVDLSLLLTPIDDVAGDFFGVNIAINGTEVGTTSTAQYTGRDLQNAEVFTDSPGTIRVSQMGLFSTHNPTPGFVEFQNGQRITNNGVTIENPPPQARITGDGYGVIPDFNNIFYSVCDYSALGTYTQRHFIAATGTVGDYSNFHDLTVTITNTSTNTQGQDTTAATTGIAAFFGLSGIVSDTVLAFGLWLLITLILSGLAFMGHWILGVLTFISLLVLGVIIGWVPLWVGLVLVIIAAGLVAVAFRNLFAGG